MIVFIMKRLLPYIRHRLKDTDTDRQTNRHTHTRTHTYTHTLTDAQTHTHTHTHTYTRACTNLYLPRLPKYSRETPYSPAVFLFSLLCRCCRCCLVAGSTEREAAATCRAVSFCWDVLDGAGCTCRRVPYSDAQSHKHFPGSCTPCRLWR